MTAVMSFCAICLLLLLGKAIRSAVPLLQRLYLPSCVIGGFIGLAAINTLGHILSPDWFAAFGRLPGFLINIVFAGLFIGAATTSLKKVWRITAPQLCFGQISAWGQYVIGLGLALFFLSPAFGVPAVFGNLLEIGFQGGHGTVGGMANTFAELGWGEGADIGYAIATAGLVFAIIVGMILINIGAHRGHISGIRHFRDKDRLERLGIYEPHAQPEAGRQTVYSDSMDSLAFHIALTGVAVFIGYCLRQLLLLADSAAPASIQELRIAQTMPLFPLCMIGGLILQAFLRRTKLDFLANRAQMQRIIGTSLDFLVVAAITSIRLEFVVAYWLPISILVLAGLLWNVATFLYIGPRIFSEAWFERSLTEFGQATGVTATGLMLLRTVDPDNKTIAAEAFGYKQLLHEPFMGGGIWTSLAVPLVMRGNVFLIWLFCLAALAIAILCWRLFFYTGKNAAVKDG